VAIVVAQQVCDDMAVVTANIRGFLDDLDSRLRLAMHDWTSEAREEYDAARTRWNAAAALMPVAVRRARDTLEQVRY
jgi:uncharacterized protein YukE